MRKIVSILIVAIMLLIQAPALAISGVGTEANPYLVSSVSDVLAIHNDLDGYYKLTASIDMAGVEFEPIGNELEGAFTGTIDGNGYSISNLNINLPDNKYVGFIGCLEGTVKNLNISNVDAYGYRYVGGIAGYVGEDAVVDNCTSSGMVGGEYLIVDPNIGGIVGYNIGTIFKCESHSDVSAMGGTNNSSQHIYTGGIAGQNYYGIISNCTNTGEITGGGYDYIGGIVGHNYFSTVSDCINVGIVTGGNHAGGIVGRNTSSRISNCTNAGIVTGQLSYIGGIVGSNTGTIKNCTNEGTVTMSSDGGGIVGYNSSGTISSCANTGTISGGTDTGGIAGYNTSSGTITNCFNKGTISGRDYTGGVVGRNYSGSVNNCTNSGKISGSSYIYDISGGTIRNITLSNHTVQRGSSTSMLIELYGYDHELTWISSDTSIATVDSEGIVTGVKVGSATITAVTELGISTSAIITVTSNASAISLDKSNITLQKGYTDRITATLTPSDAVDTVTWTSNHEDVATVSEDGVVTAVSVGSATITAKTSNGIAAYCVVTVTEPTVAVASVTLDRTSITLMSDDIAQINASVMPANATNKTLNWTSSDESVATVNSTGVVTAKSSGVAIITATAANGMYHSCVVKVVSASGPSVVLSDANIFGNVPAQVMASIVKNPGISAYKFTINYNDTMLTPVSIVPNGDFGGTFTTNLEDTSRSELNVLWYSDSDVDINDELFTINFTLNGNLSSGSSVVSLDYGDRDICNIAGDSIALYIDDAVITVAEALPGDIYEDGDINVYDITLLSRYITGLEKLTPRQLEAGDVNNDGDVDIKDVVKLAQYLVGWSGVELMSIGDNTADIKVGTAVVDENNEAYIPVSIENNSGIAGFRFNIDYDPDEVEVLEIIPNTNIITDTLQTNLGQEDENGLLVTWYQETNMTANGELFKIRVRYAGGSVSKININQADNNMCNQALENVIGDYTEGCVLGGRCVTAEQNGTVEIYSDTSYKDTPATVILAMYKQDGSLVECKTQDITLSGETQEISFDIADVSYDYTKTFVWDSLDGMKPLR